MLERGKQYTKYTIMTEWKQSNVKITSGGVLDEHEVLWRQMQVLAHSRVGLVQLTVDIPPEEEIRTGIHLCHPSANRNQYCIKIKRVFIIAFKNIRKEVYLTRCISTYLGAEPYEPWFRCALCGSSGNSLSISAPNWVFSTAEANSDRSHLSVRPSESS